MAELPKDQVAPVEHLRRVLGEWVVDVAVSANLVVLRTPPGSAHVVASALDRAGLDGAVGTVAGDDTVLIVADEAVGGKALATGSARSPGAGRDDRAGPPRPRSAPGTGAGERHLDIDSNW